MSNRTKKAWSRTAYRELQLVLRKNRRFRPYKLSEDKLQEIIATYETTKSTLRVPWHAWGRKPMSRERVFANLYCNRFGVSNKMIISILNGSHPLQVPRSSVSPSNLLWAVHAQSS